jgi:hypothetical protein
MSLRQVIKNFNKEKTEANYQILKQCVKGLKAYFDYSWLRNTLLYYELDENAINGLLYEVYGKGDD